MKTKLIFSLLLLSILSCQPPPLEFGKATRFFPPSAQLQEGIVNKYYSHNNPIDPNKGKTTDINYHAYQLITPDSLEVNFYDAGMQLMWHSIYFFEKDKIKVTDRYRVRKEDTSFVNLISDEYLDWTGNAAALEYSMQIGRKKDYKRHYKSSQTAHKDTIVNGLQCKRFEKGIVIDIVAPEGDTTQYLLNQTIVYANNIGIYEEYIKADKSNTHLELVEQMTLNEFNKRVAKVPNRIAYIDPKNTLDDNSNFKVCGKESQIADYYNGDEIGQLIGGKGQWWRLLATDLKSSKLQNESGFLTYRFVVNCKGEAGRFTTEQADLDYNKKTFHQETVDHFYSIVSSPKNWQSCIVKETILDAYVYITFKLKDGKVIEILP